MTDEEGSVTLTLPSGITGTMTLTVNKDDYKPAVSTDTTLNSAGEWFWKACTSTTDMEEYHPETGIT
jgi:hypothetical protein